MAGPGPLNLVLAALMLLTATYHGANLAWRRGRNGLGADARAETDARAEATHLLMGVVMALMLLRPLTRPASVALIAVFLVPFGWFGLRGLAMLRGGLRRQSVHRLHHCLLCGAMLVMLLSSARSPMPLMRLQSPDASMVPAPVLALVAALLVLVVWNLDQAALPSGGPTGARIRLSVAGTASCRVLTCLAMSYVLLAMR